MRKQNSYCLKEKLRSELYAEIDRMEPVFRHLLAAQLRGEAKEGMSSLRQSVSPSSSTPPQKPAHELDEGRGGNTFYEWLDPQKVSDGGGVCGGVDEGHGDTASASRWCAILTGRWTTS